MSNGSYFKKITVLVVFLLSISLNSIANTTILNIDSENKTPEEIGNQLGIEIKNKFPTLEFQYDSYLDFLLSDMRFDYLNRQVQLLKKSLNPEHLVEINAVANMLDLDSNDKLGDGKLSKNEFWLLQFLSDLIIINKGIAIAVINESNHDVIIARNLKWKSTPSLRQLQTVTVYNSSEKTWVNVGFAGILGVVNGFNNDGLFVSAINSSSELVTAKVLKNHHSVAFMLKETLQQTNVYSASQFLDGKHYPRDQQILLADKKKVLVLEQPTKANGSVRTVNSTITQTMSKFEKNSNKLIVVSCFVLKNSPKNCYSSGDYYRWNRSQVLLKEFDLNSPIGSLSTVMQDHKNGQQAIFNHNTLESIIFIPSSQTLYLFSRSISNTKDLNNNYHKLQLVKNQKSKTSSLGMLIFTISAGILMIVLSYIFYIPTLKMKTK